MIRTSSGTILTDHECSVKPPVLLQATATRRTVPTGEDQPDQPVGKKTDLLRSTCRTRTPIAFSVKVLTVCDNSIVDTSGSEPARHRDAGANMHD